MLYGFLFVQSVSFVNGALSWVALNVLAAFLVLFVLLAINQTIGKHCRGLSVERP